MRSFVLASIRSLLPALVASVVWLGCGLDTRGSLASGGGSGGSGGEGGEGGEGGQGGEAGRPPCAAGRGDCDGDVANGCEVDLSADAKHCGSCQHACKPAPHAGVVCSGGACVLRCEPDRADCDKDAANGCEVDLKSDPKHCGSCEGPCPAVAHGQATCEGGHCVGACEAGYGDCDKSLLNGCEVDLRSDAAHCGSCDGACVKAANAAVACAQSHCVSTCEAGFDDCDDDAENGCEVDLRSDAAHCGACGKACGGDHVPPSCSNGACATTCEVGFADCDGDAKNGCEADLLTDPIRCGGCAGVCPASNGKPSCSGGKCALACSAGFGECDGDPKNGCETDLNTTLAHCGGCGKACPGGHGTPSCGNGACALACDAGFADCNGQAADGCETELASSAEHCGACGHGCLGGACAGGRCQPVVLASGEPYPSDIALDDSSVYWLDLGTLVGTGNEAHFVEGSLRSMPKAGGAPASLAEKLPVPERLTVQSGTIYFSCAGSYPSYADGTIHRSPTTGGDAALVAGQPLPLGIATSPGAIYWVDRLAHIVARSGLDGSAPTALVAGQLYPSTVRFANNAIYWTALSSPTDAAGNFANAYLATSNPDGAGAAVLSGGHVNLDLFVVDAAAAYLVVPGSAPDFADGAIRRVDLATGAASSLAEGLPHPVAIAQDSQYLYWTLVGTAAASYQNGGIVRQAKAGGAPEALLTTGLGPQALAVDAKAIYFVAAFSASICRLAL